MAPNYRNWYAYCTYRMGRVNDSMVVVETLGKVICMDAVNVTDVSSFVQLLLWLPIE
jgi:hypothetical protein